MDARGSALTGHAASAHRAEVDHERDHESDYWPERPVSAEPVMDRGIPEQCCGQKDEPDDGPQEIVEYTAEPVSEEPKERDDESRRGQGHQSHDAGHRSGFLARSALQSGVFGAFDDPDSWFSRVKLARCFLILHGLP